MKDHPLLVVKSSMSLVDLWIKRQREEGEDYMFKHIIGNKSEKIKNKVERAMVKKFAQAIGDAHPIYIDEATGKKSRYGENIAPPTFPQTFDYGEVPDLILPENHRGIIHGEQNYHYKRPLLIGEEIYCFTEVVDYYERTGSSGLMGFLNLTNYGEDSDGKLIFSIEQILIITEAVREALQN